jgi:hypothetical protein
LILLIFASCVTGITGMSYLTPFHQDKCLSVFMFFIGKWVLQWIIRPSAMIGLELILCMKR